MAAVRRVVLSQDEEDMDEDVDEENFVSGPVDAILIANDVAVSASLTKLDVRYNDLGDEGEAAIKEAVHCKEAFKLLVDEDDSDDDEDDSPTMTRMTPTMTTTSKGAVSPVLTQAC